MAPEGMIGLTLETKPVPDIWHPDRTLYIGYVRENGKRLPYNTCLCATELVARLQAGKLRRRILRNRDRLF